jgi:hypothetical protein
MVSMKHLNDPAEISAFQRYSSQKIQAPDMTRSRNIKNTNGPKSTIMIMNEQIFRRMIYIVTKSNISAPCSSHVI